MRLIILDANKFKFKQDLLWISVSALATIIIWIIYSIYVAFTAPTTDPEINQLLTPINPTLDQEVLNQLDDVYQPPTDYTILVKQEVGESTQIVPLGAEASPDLDKATNNEDLSGNTSPAPNNSTEDSDIFPTPTPTLFP